MLYSTMSQTIMKMIFFSTFPWDHEQGRLSLRQFGGGRIEVFGSPRVGSEQGNMGALRSTLSFGLLTAFVGFTVSAFESNIFDTVSEW